MLFSSIEFLVFFTLLLTLMKLVNSEGFRRNILLAFSYLYYGWWDWRFCFLLLGLTLVDYSVGIKIVESKTPRERKGWLLASLISNLGCLAFFKYTNFFLENFTPIFKLAGVELPHLNILLPIGISFFTFQSISYVIDVYRGVIPAHRNIRDYMLFVAFFPQLLAGPIVRGSFFLPQMEKIHPLKSENLRLGFQRFFRGFVKKLLFADTFAVFADVVFANPLGFDPVTCWLGALAYTAQIYYDFSGYTDMAVGVAKMLGIEFPTNFEHPYLSRNITEFWRRWHISLSSWLRDYLYIPLGGNRKGKLRTYANLFTTMLLGGLWHGASWTFVAWGAMHGTALAVHKLFSDSREPKPEGLAAKVLSWGATLVFVTVAWVFFRSPDFATASQMLGRMAFVIDGPGVSWHYVQAMVGLGAAFALHLWSAMNGYESPGLDLRKPMHWPALIMICLFILLFAPTGTNPFIYFQF